MKLTCMRATVLCLGLSTLGLFGGSSLAYAQTELYKSGDPVIGGVGGATLGFGQDLGGRFTLTDTYTITDIFVNAGGNGSMFLAINPVSSLSSFPANDLSGNLFETSYSIPSALSTNIEVLTNFTLGPGTYAVTTGTDLFGATGLGYMPFTSPRPNSNLFIGETDGASSFNTSANFAFEVDGKLVGSSVTPEGSSLAMMGLGLLPLVFGLRKRLRKA
jgi:hypothetical protein